MVLEILAATAGSLFSLFVFLKCCVCIHERKTSKISKQQSKAQPLPVSKSLKIPKSISVPPTIPETPESPDKSPIILSPNHLNSSSSSSSSWKSSLSNMGDFIEDFMDPNDRPAQLSDNEEQPEELELEEETTFVIVDDTDFDEEDDFGRRDSSRDINRTDSYAMDF